MIAIIAAMDLEVKYIKEKMTNVVTRKILKTEFYVGNLAKKLIVLVKCGIGKVMSSHTTTLLIEHFKPSLIINTGVAGGIMNDANVLDLIISDKIGYYDVDITHFGDLAFGQMANMPHFFQTRNDFINQASEIAKKQGLTFHIGDILSGDSFITNRKTMDQIIENHFEEWNVVAVDMESVSIAQIAYVCGVPLLVIRALSDKVGADSQAMVYQDFVNQAAHNASIVVEEFIKEIHFV